MYLHAYQKDDRLQANLAADAVRLRALLRRYVGNAEQARDFAVPLVLFVPVAIDPATASRTPLVVSGLGRRVCFVAVKEPL